MRALGIFSFCAGLPRYTDQGSVSAVIEVDIVTYVPSASVTPFVIDELIPIKQRGLIVQLPEITECDVSAT